MGDIEMRTEIIRALSVLIRKPMWDSGRAMDMQMFSFGGRIEMINRKGRPTATGEFSLHLQCPWSFRDDKGHVLVGSADRMYRRDDSGDFVTEEDKGIPTLLERNMRSVVFSADRPLWLVEQVDATQAGELTLTFVGGASLRTFADCSQRSNELWRFFPDESRRGIEGSHFVIYSGGLDTDEE